MSGQQTVTDFVLDTAEVMQKILELEKRWGKRNLRILLAYNCTFGGRVRSMETRMTMIDEVLSSVTALKEDEPK